MLIENLETLKVWDRYDGDLLSLCYDKTSKYYYIEICKELWDEYVYYKVSFEEIQRFSFNGIPLEQIILNKECLLYINGVFSKSLGIYSSTNEAIYEKGWFDYVVTDWSLNEFVAFHLFGYNSVENHKDGLIYQDRNGGLHGEIDLTDFDVLTSAINLIAKYNQIDITIYNGKYIATFWGFNLEALSLKNLYIKILETKFYGVYRSEVV